MTAPGLQHGAGGFLLAWFQGQPAQSKSLAKEDSARPRGLRDYVPGMGGSGPRLCGGGIQGASAVTEAGSVSGHAASLSRLFAHAQESARGSHTRLAVLGDPTPDFLPSTKNAVSPCPPSLISLDNGHSVRCLPSCSLSYNVLGIPECLAQGTWNTPGPVQGQGAWPCFPSSG